jgi:rod shape determining protein RodA
MIIAACLLAILGVVVIFSSSPTQAYQQGLFALIGVMLFLGISRFDYRALKSISWMGYAVVILLLLIVFIIGVETRGSVRWITLGWLNIQPSELAKPVLVLVLAYFWQNRRASWRNIGLSLGILLPIFLFVFRQPDLGTSLTIMFIWLSMLVAANISVLKVIFMGIVGAIVTPFSWHFLEDYQKSRLLSFLVPDKDPLGVGFHVIQSQIAVGSGQIFGRGLGRGTQSRLQFLPEFRTDFIFAFIAEELGLFGAGILLSLYAVIFYLCVRVISQTVDRLGNLIVTGILGMLVFQMVVNVGMNIGIMPVTGITLPLLSYGGSSLLVTFISLGLVESVRKYGKTKTDTESISIL